MCCIIHQIWLSQSALIVSNISQVLRTWTTTYASCVPYVQIQRHIHLNLDQKHTLKPSTEKNCSNVNFVKLNFHIRISSNLIVDLFMKGLDILVAVATNFLCIRFSYHIYFFQGSITDLFEFKAQSYSSITSFFSRNQRSSIYERSAITESQGLLSSLKQQNSPPTQQLKTTKFATFGIIINF